MRVGESLERDGSLSVDIAASHATTFIKLGEVQLHAGRPDDARRSFTRAVELIGPRAAEFPDRHGIQRLLGVAQYKQIEYFRAVAQDPVRPAAERVALWRSAADWADRCRETFIDMRERNVLDASDAGVPEELAAEAESCRTAARALEGAAPAERP